MNYLSISGGYQDPAILPVEVVERKGVGHPDSLADALANEVSAAYSRYCLGHFGFILHHNTDKLYIGAGYYQNDFGWHRRLQPIQVRTNGRMSNSFAGESIDIRQIQTEAIRRYLFKVMPQLTDADLSVIPNATQHTKVPHWFNPRTRADVPDADQPKANDTAFCVAHWPPTPIESLVYRLERYFWEPKDGMPTPKFQEIGQDIKVLAVRRGDTVEATLCVPTISGFTPSYDQYQALIQQHERALMEIGDEIGERNGLTVSVRINPYQRLYMLGVGSCVECGEEGIAGRGNAINGVISSHRVHTQEAWAGKNPVYHTGRVMGYLTLKLARSIGEELGVKCAVSVMTRCGDSMFPPHMVHVAIDKESVDQVAVQRRFEEDILSADYVEEILSFRPWLMEL